jgi:hypothetical protein
VAILDRIAAARDPAFASRVAMVALKLSLDVANEAPTTPNHANRIALAYLMFRAEVNAKALAAAVIASNGTIQAAIDAAPGQHGSSVTDGDLEFVVSGLYDHFANAYAAAPPA